MECGDGVDRSEAFKKFEMNDRDEVCDPTLGETPSEKNEREAAANILY